MASTATSAGDAGGSKVVATTAFDDQRPGTSGLRKKVKVFQTDHYLENFIQAIFDCLDGKQGATLVVSGDGRYLSVEASHTIIRMAVANGISRLIVGQNFLMSTPAVSSVIRSRKAYGGIILTASHNPGGPNGDFGVKYNMGHGGPAPAEVTEAMYERSRVLKEYHICEGKPQFNANQVGEYSFGSLIVEVIDAPKAYADMMRSIFDFNALRPFVARKDFNLVFDGMHGVAGPFARQILCTELGCSESALLNCVPKPDFNGGHPDPNLTYAHELVQVMGLGEEKKEAVPDFGAAADGDADRNMILGARTFVTPSDSLAIITHFAKDAIPYFSKGLHGVARSMPTSRAVDLVAQKLGLGDGGKAYEVPTGWKFFCNLMDAQRVSICGEESFGTGSDHIREKDGLWAVLAWLSILQHVNAQLPAGAPLKGVSDVMREFWAIYGRFYYLRYDYEELPVEAANKVWDALGDMVVSQELVKGGSTKIGDLKLTACDDYDYTDPVDASRASCQGFRFFFEAEASASASAGSAPSARVVFRKSGTGSVGATIRLYLEVYEPATGKLDKDANDAVAPLAAWALAQTKFTEHTGVEKPTVIT